MRLLVCGGREYADAELVNATLDAVHELTPITHLITGGAPGADALAVAWLDRFRGLGRRIDITVSIFGAEWDKYGKRAGPIRNQRMLDEGKPDRVIAFPGGKGTEDMIRRAMKANISTTIIR